MKYKFILTIFFYYFYKIFVFLLSFILFTFAAPTTNYQGPIVCNLCVDTVNHLKDIVEDKGIESARKYRDELCAQAPGFISNICTNFVNFGMDEILKLIENRVQPEEICQKIEACPIEIEIPKYKGDIVCNLCIGAIDKIKEILERNRGQRVKDYIDNLCDKASGFINTLCNKIIDFGIDKLIKLIENKVDSQVICEKIHAC